MRVLGVIPARGGSKGIPRKNIRLLGGKPLIAWTIEAARQSRLLTRVILSTEDEEIAAVGRQWGVEVPFLRPAELAQDDTPTLPVVLHALDWFAAHGESFEAVMVLQPTNPLRTAQDIDGAIERLEKTGADSVISFVDVGEKHPARMKVIDQDLRVWDPPFAEPKEGMRRQDLPKYYLREGSIYLTRVNVLLEQQSFRGKDCRAWIIEPQRAVNIDEEMDFLLAEVVLRFSGRWNP